MHGISFCLDVLYIGMQLKAGPIQLQYERSFLRTLAVNGHEILRMIYVALRNRDWNTAPVALTNEVVRSEVGGFRINYDWQTHDFGMHMAGHVQIEGLANGLITFDFSGKATANFWRNRVGLCVLHPVEGLAGQPCSIQSPDGQVLTIPFPDLISPYQPFLNVQSMSWQVAGNHVRADFFGDVFETEDQRNWTDASYKTYSTPLERPYPVEVRAGTRVRQRVMIRLEESAQLPPANPLLAATPRTIRQQPQTAPIRIGLGYPADEYTLTTEELSALQSTGLAHLRADVWLSDGHGQAGLLKAAENAQRLNVPLELAAFFGADATPEAGHLVEFLRQHRVAVYSILLFQADTSMTTDALLNNVVPVLRARLPDVLLGGGTDGNFVDLNRHRFDFGLVDFVTYSINPQVHASDDQTLMENVAGQADTVRSARVLSGGKPVHISPVTLRPRFNPDATSGSARDVPPIDLRLTTEFGAEWTRRSLRALTEAGAASVTYHETHGPRGLVNRGKIYPVLGVFRRVG